jgi:hypothetical protein
MDMATKTITMKAKYRGRCAAGKLECRHGGKVIPGQEIVWLPDGVVFHTGICEDIFWGNMAAAHEAEQERLHEQYTLELETGKFWERF